jgi:hypothetical protein
MMIPGTGSRLQQANGGGVENDTRVSRPQRQERLLAINDDVAVGSPVTKKVRTFDIVRPPHRESL